MELNDAQLIKCWERLGDIPVDSENCIEQDFIINEHITFNKGDDLLDIWHWFDEHYSKGVHSLMFNRKK